MIAIQDEVDELGERSGDHMAEGVVGVDHRFSLMLRHPEAGAATGSVHHDPVEPAKPATHHTGHGVAEEPMDPGSGSAGGDRHEVATSPRPPNHLAWSLVALLALALLVETGWLVSRSGRGS